MLENRARSQNKGKKKHLFKGSRWLICFSLPACLVLYMRLPNPQGVTALGEGTLTSILWLEALTSHGPDSPLAHTGVLQEQL